MAEDNEKPVAPLVWVSPGDARRGRDSESILLFLRVDTRRMTPQVAAKLGEELLSAAMYALSVSADAADAQAEQAERAVFKSTSLRFLTDAVDDDEVIASERLDRLWQQLNDLFTEGIRKRQADEG